MVYEFKPGSRIKVNAQVAGEVCEKLEAQGNLSAETLLEVSRPVNAPLHDEFEWDDGTAAEEYRKMQARHIINCLVVKIEDSPAAEPVRVFFNLCREEREYLHINTILQDPDDTAALLKRALSELDAFAKKYRQLTELAAVMAAIDETMEKEEVNL